MMMLAAFIAGIVTGIAGMLLLDYAEGAGWLGERYAWKYPSEERKKINE